MFHRFVVASLILGFISVDQALSQTQYRKPSNSDIEWLLGKSVNRVYYDTSSTSPCKPVCQEQPATPPNKSKKESSVSIVKPTEEIAQPSDTIEVLDDFPKGVPLDEILPASMKKQNVSKPQTKTEPKLVPKVPVPQPCSASKCTKPLDEPTVKEPEICGDFNSCQRYAEECVTVKPFGNFFRLSGCRQLVGHQHGTCCCRLYSDLDTPDMIGDAAWIPDRFVRFTSTGGESASFSVPTAMMSRLNIAEHFNAEARDRLWLDFRHLNNAMSLAGKNFRQTRDVDQLTFGFETCVTNNLSAELRVPVVNQFNSKQPNFDLGNRLGGSDTELGNLSLIFKYVLCRTENFTVAGGFGIVFPTAEDWRIPTLTASLQNKSYYLVPYLGFQWHPNEKTFGHFLVQTDVPVSGNELRFDSKKLDVKEPTTVRLGWQIGRWFYRNEYDSHSCRLGGFLELDYSITSGHGKFGGISDDIYIGSNGNKPQPVNLSLGMPILFGQLMITNAVMLPITNKDRLFSVGYDFSLSRRF